CRVSGGTCRRSSTPPDEQPRRIRRPICETATAPPLLREAPVQTSALTGRELSAPARAHVLYVQPSELFGGAERQVAAMLPQLQRQGVAVTALVGPGRTIVDWLRGAGVKDIVHSPAFPRDHSDARGFGWLA